MDCLRDKGYTFTEEAVAAGLAGAYLPCRQEVLRPDPLVLADGAHNPHGVAALADTLRRHRPQGGLTMVIGMLGDKDTAACAALLAPLCAHIVCCAPANARALPAEELAEQLRPGCGDVRTAGSPRQALRLAEELAHGGDLLVAGSFFLAAELRPLLLLDMREGRLS